MAATVLVVEDEVKIRDLLRSYFERKGYSVLSTSSGAEAIEMTRTAAPDLVVLDLRLPDVSGETVAGEIRLFSNVPVLMLTAKSAEHDRIRGLELGADDYVTKPFSPREVVLRAQAIQGYERTIDSHVKNLRRKVELDPRRPKIVETVLGAGYRLGLARDT